MSEIMKEVVVVEVSLKAAEVAEVTVVEEEWTLTRANSEAEGSEEADMTRQVDAKCV